MSASARQARAFVLVAVLATLATLTVLVGLAPTPQRNPGFLDLGRGDVTRLGPVALLSNDWGFVTTRGALVRFDPVPARVQASSEVVLTASPHPLGWLLRAYDVTTGEVTFTRPVALGQEARVAGPNVLVLERSEEMPPTPEAAQAGQGVTPADPYTSVGLVLSQPALPQPGPVAPNQELVVALGPTGQVLPWSVPAGTRLRVPTTCGHRCTAIPVQVPGGGVDPRGTGVEPMSLDPRTGILTHRPQPAPPLAVSVSSGRAPGSGGARFVVSTPDRQWSPPYPATSAAVTPSRAVFTTPSALFVLTSSGTPLGALSLTRGPLAGCTLAEVLERAAVLRCDGILRVAAL